MHDCAADKERQLTSNQLLSASVPVGEFCANVFKGTLETCESNDIQSIIELSVSYSKLHQYLLRKGELLLSKVEAEKINAVLGSLYPGWVFYEVPDEVERLDAGGKLGRRSISIGGSKKSKRKLTSLPTKDASKTLSQFRPSKDNVPSQQGRYVDKDTATQRATKALLRQLKSSPYWVRRLHGIILQLSQTAVAKPFTRESDPSDFDYGAVSDAIQPRLTPIGLHSVLSKLEQGFYSTVLEAFNDLYSVWLCAYRFGNVAQFPIFYTTVLSRYYLFRIYPPGSPLWIQAHESSRSFFQLISSETIRDDFSPTAGKDGGSGVEHNEGVYSRQSSVSSSSRVKRTSNMSVDKLFQEFLEQQEKKASLAATGGSRAKAGTENLTKMLSNESLTSSAGGKVPSSIARKTKKSGGTASTKKRVTSEPLDVQPISEEERTEFQEYLALLQPHHHLMLYEAFRRSAVWRSIESGEVELDDALTSSAVFHKMIIWCKTQVAVQNPSSIIETQLNSTQGKGKIVPGVPDSSTKGKLSTSRTVESRLSSLHSPKYSSTSSNTSSSSTSSSSSDEDNDEEKYTFNPHNINKEFPAFTPP